MPSNKTVSLLIPVFLFLLQACTNGRERVVSVSILPQKYMVEKIAGDYLQVNVMVPPGMNPATCDLNIEQLKKLHDSDLCFIIGHLPFETTHLLPVLESRRDIRVVNHSEGIPLLRGSCRHHTPEHHHGADPHIWVSPTHAVKMAEDIYQALADRYPDRRDTFRLRRDTFLQEINGIARKAQHALANRRGRTFLIYHPALTYFAEDYGLHQLSIEDEGKEPDPTHLKTIIDRARAQHIRLVFIQKQFDEQNARSVAREIGGEVVPIDPLAEDWTAEMNRLIDILKEKL